MLNRLSALYLSSRPLKQLTVCAMTTSSGRLFHRFTTLLLKKFCRNWVRLLRFASFKVWPPVVRLADSCSGRISFRNLVLLLTVINADLNCKQFYSKVIQFELWDGAKSVVYRGLNIDHLQYFTDSICSGNTQHRFEQVQAESVHQWPGVQRCYVEHRPKLIRRSDYRCCKISRSDVKCRQRLSNATKKDTGAQCRPGASIPMGQGGHVPPIFGRGGHDHECPPPNISKVISATFYPCNIFLISWKSF